MNEDLMELEAQQCVEAEREDDTPTPMKRFEMKFLAEGFSFIDKALAISKQQDPNVERCTKVANQIDDAMQCYRKKENCPIVLRLVLSVNTC